MKRANPAKRGAQNYIELVAITWKNIGKILWWMLHLVKKNWLLTLIEGGYLKLVPCRRAFFWKKAS